MKGLTKDELRRYLVQANKMLADAELVGLEPLSCAIFGAAMINAAVKTYGHDYEWWFRFIRDPKMREDA